MSRNEGRVNPSEDEALEQEEPTPMSYPTRPPSSDDSGFNWTNPTYFVDLPSKGKFYPPSHPLHGKEHVEIKYMTAKEEDYLTSQPLLRKGIAIDRVLESVLVDKSIDLDGLLLGDKNAIMVGARITGYGEEYSVNVTCPKCKADTNYEFNLEQIENWDFESKLEELACEFTPKNTVLVQLPYPRLMLRLSFLMDMMIRN